MPQCRSRRVKCDESRPACDRCRQNGLLCGYENSLIFDSDSGDRALRYRRPVLSLEERVRMSERIASCVPPDFAQRSIADIDNRCESAPSSELLSIFDGPFGAFRFPGDVQAIEKQSPRFIPVHDTEVLHEDNGEVSLHNGTLMSADTQRTLESLLGDDTIYDLDVSLLDTAKEMDIFQDILTADTSYSRMHMEDFSTSHIMAEDATISNTTLDGRPAHHFALSRSITPLSCTEADVPQSAWVLLKHYLNNVLKAMTPFNHSKTPWHILFVPLVRNCLAGLALQDEIDPASLCVFYGTLAISSSTLSSTSQSPNWARKSDEYREKAYEQGRTSLDIAYDVPKKLKYKTQLMALLTMIQMSVVAGEQDKTGYFFLEAEKFIRMRGLNRKKSRKVRLLHHCYAYERILYESTVVRNATSTQYHRHVRRAIEASGACVYSKDALTFRLSQWENLETDILVVKDRELGENDLHLQIPGTWPDTLYPEIFGVPEVHLLIISLVIRLARERDTEDMDDTSNNLDLKTFTARAKAIEKLIKLQRPPTPSPNTSLTHLIEATYHALVIFFYRKIHDIDSSMLQQQVSNVRDCVLRHEGANCERGFASMGLIWPASVAAREAEEPTTQTYFSQWFETAAQESGLPLFRSKLAGIKEVWRERQRGVVPMLGIN